MDDKIKRYLHTLTPNKLRKELEILSNLYNGKTWQVDSNGEKKELTEQQKTSLKEIGSYIMKLIETEALKGNH